jgi:hypothetical protein
MKNRACSQRGFCGEDWTSQAHSVVVVDANLAAFVARALKNSQLIRASGGRRHDYM